MNRRMNVYGAASCALGGCVALFMLAGCIFVYRLAMSPAAQSSRHNATGNRYYSAGKYAEAATEYTEMINIQPKSADGYFLRAMAYYKMQRYSKAAADDTAVIKMASTLNVPASVHEDAHYNRGLDYKALHKNREAIQDFDAALRWNPANQDATTNRADCYRLLGDPQSGAVEGYAQFKQHQAEFNKCMSQGSADLSARQYSDAEGEYRAAIRINPADANGWATLSWAQYENGSVSAAIETGKIALKIDPNLGYARVNQGLYYAVQGNWAAAKSNYEGAQPSASSQDYNGATQDIQNAEQRYASASPTLDKAQQLLISLRNGKTR
jgi:tetratricopeptide (TPR) repeat protein